MNSSLFCRMRFKILNYITIIGVMVLITPVAAGAGPSPDPRAAEFRLWLNQVRADAIVQGISITTLDRLLPGIKIVPRVQELDSKQPEFTLSLAEYLGKVIDDKRINRGDRRIRKNRKVLRAIADKYQVPVPYIVALWGIETNYGHLTGGFQVVDALATLAFDGRRKDFFRGQLLDALRILDQGHITVSKMSGSWAGAMGQCQFMPSSFLSYSVDEDGDGRRDIWNSRRDVWASIANYLHTEGWDPAVGWGQEVIVPEDLNPELQGLEQMRSLAEWSHLGVTPKSGAELGSPQTMASLLQPDGEGQRAYLVYRNFHVLMHWNRSHKFGLSVGHLADALEKKTGEAGLLSDKR